MWKMRISIVAIMYATAHGQVTGRVTYIGAVPSDDAYNVKSNFLRAAHVPNLNPLWRVSEGGGIESVVVYFEGTGLPGGAKFERPASATHIEIKKYSIEPHLIAVMAGQPIDIVNRDDCKHIIYGHPELNEGVGVALEVGGINAKPVGMNPLDREEKFLLRCVRHRWMSAWICCFSHPYFAATKVNGTFEIPRPIPDGEYQVVAWHESGKSQTRKIVVKDGKATVNFGLSADGAIDSDEDFLCTAVERGVVIPQERKEVLERVRAQLVPVDEGGYAVGAFDEQAGIFYRWRGVLLKRSEVTGHAASTQPALSARLVRRVVLYEKPIVCSRMGSGRWVMGFFDRPSGFLYRWATGGWLTNHAARAAIESHVAEQIDFGLITLPPIDIDVPPYLLATVRTLSLEGRE